MPMKRYSRPSASPLRGARVVHDTDSTSDLSWSSKALTRLDLPAPLGATIMKTLPGCSDMDRTDKQSKTRRIEKSAASMGRRPRVPVVFREIGRASCREKVCQYV